jgi:hypothetical protein
VRLRETTHPLLGRLRVVLPRVGPRDGDSESLAPQSPDANGDLATRKLNASEWLSSKGTVPACWLVIPRPHENPAFDNDDPDAGVAVLGPGADTEDLGFAKLLECRPLESSCSGHFCRYNHTKPVRSSFMNSVRWL